MPVPKACFNWKRESAQEELRRKRPSPSHKVLWLCQKLFVLIQASLDWTHLQDPVQILTIQSVSHSITSSQHYTKTCCLGEKCFFFHNINTDAILHPSIKWKVLEHARRVKPKQGLINISQVQIRHLVPFQASKLGKSQNTASASPAPTSIIMVTHHLSAQQGCPV